VAIILQGYHDTSEISDKVFNQDVRDKFAKVWSEFD
jgi:hypothetical protein